MFSQQRLSLEFDQNLVDIKTTYAKSIIKMVDQVYPISTNILDNPVEERIKHQLFELGKLSSVYSRFRLDKSFPVGSADKLFQIWVENSINGSMADVIFVEYLDDVIAGMISVAISSNKEATIGLLAVSPEFQGRGIASKLLLSAESYSKTKKIQTLLVATQNHNVPAMKLYKRAGFEIISKVHIYHLWKK